MMNDDDAIAIRPRQDEDIPILAAVLVRVHPSGWLSRRGSRRPRGVAEAGARELAAWTALNQDNPIGHISLAHAAPSDDAATLWQSLTRGEIERLVIAVRLFRRHPPHRGGGAGGRLMLAAHGYAADHDFEMAFDVMLKDDSAIRLYETLGVPAPRRHRASP